MKCRAHIPTCLLLVTGMTAFGQQAEPPDDPLSAPTAHGFSMTPEIARSVGSFYVEHMMINMFELDESRKDEAVDKVTRRIMELAHKLDGPGQELVERFIEEQFNNTDHTGFLPKGFAKEFAERLLPMLPEIRSFWTDTNRDLRPMLPFKQQMKMAGQVTAFNAAFDAFEENMKKWAAGEAGNTDNPFDVRSREEKIEEVELREDGISEHLHLARNSARSSALDQQKGEWERYLEQFKAFYELNDSQYSAAQALLRAHLDRLAERLNNPDWQKAYYRNRLWTLMAQKLPDYWQHPLNQMLQDEFEMLMTRAAEQRNAFKRELLAIPTEAQKHAAMKRMEELLIERGIFTADEEMHYPRPEVLESADPAEQQADAGS